MIILIGLLLTWIILQSDPMVGLETDLIDCSGWV